MNIKALEIRYPYHRPGISLQLITLGLIATAGLIALFIAAYHAFLLVANPWQAFFAALVIEAGLIVEALALINKPKTVYPWIGLIISYSVSGTYNYTQAAAAGMDLGRIELFALAFGPLSALAVVSLTFGNELRSYQERVTEWQENRAEWVEAEYKRLEQQRAEAEQQRRESEQKHTEKMARIEAKRVSGGVSKTVSDEPKMSQSEMIDYILKQIRDTGNETQMTQLAEQLGVSRSTLYRRLDWMQKEGMIHKNGEGWKVN